MIVAITTHRIDNSKSSRMHYRFLVWITYAILRNNSQMVYLTYSAQSKLALCRHYAKYVEVLLGMADNGTTGYIMKHTCDA